MKKDKKTYTVMYEVRKGDDNFPERFNDLVKALNNEIIREKNENRKQKLENLKNKMN